MITFTLKTQGLECGPASTRTELIIAPSSSGYGVRAYNTQVNASGYRGSFAVSSYAKIYSISAPSASQVNFILQAGGTETGTANTNVTLTIKKTSSGYTVSANNTSAYSSGVRGAEALQVTTNATISGFTATTL